MFTIEKSIFINRPQQEVFDYVSDAANVHKWQSQMISAEWSSEGPHGIGSTQRAVARFLGRSIEATSEITTWDPPNHHGFKVVSGPFPLEGGMKFVSEGNGTKVTMDGQLEVGGFFKLAEGLVRKQLESQFVTNLEALKLLLEAG
ncbi:MAG TPA: SRPBCC family protein [Anaerolineales bacterium]